jgi:hypothetical protein
MDVGRTVLIALVMLGASVWVGSLVCLAVVSAASRTVLDGSARVALFRGIGRLYGVLGPAALLVAIGAGLGLAWPLSELSGTAAAVFWLSGLLVACTAAGMAQARRMTERRRRLLEAPCDPIAARAVRRGAALAAALRASLGVLTLVIIGVSAHVLAR